ncbi:MAG: hypothetical protein DWQ44_13355 [Bacteroidetes bacterium]|nr:MAG: hypothetical protein DWQ33_08165 [Bacteroidota bacterium]REK05747.1 MAG: hypothetical protein DWQ39_04890 [Bacteroidota bacterium]REK31946.1 MAG: hypothetical protein DWQ44_13355 [Bacteroidota bacterium]REK50012.1 MAG: hypothetical protein DWQ48_05580 [Bacteroidota bacterium]
MNTDRSGRITAIIIIGIFLLLSFMSCKKDGPSIAIITVVDSAGRSVQGASVTLWQDTAVNSTNGVQATVRETQISDAAGRAEFSFQLEAFLNIDVIKGQDTGKSFIRLKQHETVYKTVTL